MMSREKELVIRRAKVMMKYDPEARRVTVSYLWTAHVGKLTDKLGQAVAFQSSVERRLLKEINLADAYNNN